MRVIAIERGYDGLMVREPGALGEDGKPVVFEMPDGKVGTWFVPVDEDGKPIGEVKRKPAVDPKVVPGQGPKRGSQLGVAGASKNAADVNVNALA